MVIYIPRSDVNTRTTLFEFNPRGNTEYQVHSLYKGHLPIADTLAWSCGVRNLEVPLYIQHLGPLLEQATMLHMNKIRIKIHVWR